MAEPLLRIDGVAKRFGEVVALDDIAASIPPGQVTGLVGPDGAGKTTLIRLAAGLLLPDAGTLTVCGYDSVEDADEIHGLIGYMPQRFGLYEDLSVAENLTLHAELRGMVGTAREEAFDRLLAFSGLEPFRKRLAGALSGGMKQKLGLACALISEPRLLLLDEPSVGVDPVSRRELWRMVDALAAKGIGVVWSTSYLDEAERCASVLLLSEGRLLYDGAPAAFTKQVKGRSFAVTGIAGDKRAVQARAIQAPGVIDALIQGRSVRLVTAPGSKAPAAAELEAGKGAKVRPVPPRFEDAFVARLMTEGTARHAHVVLPTAAPGSHGGPVVEARGLTRRFGDFTAVDDVDFAVERGEIFGLLGPNGAGKSTTFKMMCGLLPPSAGTARVAGIDLGTAAASARARIGYMSQKFSLYGQLSVAQNLEFFSGVYGLAGRGRRQTVAAMVEDFGLRPYLSTNAEDLALGFKQRLALAASIMHRPAILFLDEPTSGVDPLTRREFWNHINELAGDGVTVLVTTHFLDEAEYCDRIGIVYRGRLVATGAPDALKDPLRTPERPEPTLEDAFIHLIEREEAA